VSEVTLRASVDSYTDDDRPKANHGDAEKIILNSAGKRGWIFHTMPFKKGNNVISGILRLYLRGSGWAGGPHTITASRVNEKWREDTLTDTNAPTDISGTNTASVAVTGGSEGDAVEIDISLMLEDVAAGSKWFGVMLEVDTSGDKAIHSGETTTRNKVPEIDVIWSNIPDRPTELHPHNHVIDGGKPTVAWSFQDRKGESVQQAYSLEISVDPDVDPVTGDFLTTTFASGWLTAVETEADLNAIGYSGVADGDRVYWHVKSQDEHGMESDWSNEVWMERHDKGVLTITNPANSGTVVSHTPLITHTFTGTQVATAYFLYEWDDDTTSWQLIWHRGKKTTTDLSVEVPPHLIKEEGAIGSQAFPYRVNVRVWDDQRRAALPGNKPWAHDENHFLFDKDNGNEVDAIEVVRTFAPMVRLQFHVGTEPNFFSLLVTRPGQRPKHVAQRIDPDDLVDPAGSTYNYQYDYWGAVPGELATYEMCPVVLSGGELKVIKANETVDNIVSLAGAWLVRPSTGEAVLLAGRGQRSLKIGEDSTIFNPIHRRDPVMVTESIRGYEGSIGGVLTRYNGVTADQYKNMLERMKGAAGTDEIRLILKNTNIPVLLQEMTISPAAIGNKYDVSVNFVQNGEYTFKTQVDR
jgi:hypothetical protein